MRFIHPDKMFVEKSLINCSVSSCAWLRVCRWPVGWIRSPALRHLRRPVRQRGARRTAGQSVLGVGVMMMGMGMLVVLLLLT
jgi:hypothetical protein